MKRPIIYKTFNRALISLFIFVFPVFSAAQYNEKRIFERTEQVNRETTLEINNKYGTIEITNWNRDEISIKAEIEATASSREKTGKLIEGISIDISATKYMVRVTTGFAKTLNAFLQSFKGMTNKLISYDSKVQINYLIKAPSYLNLKIDNRYGDIILDEWNANAYISLSNGSFKTKSLSRGSELIMSFATVFAGRVDECSIKSSFSEFVIDEAASLRLNSVSSKYDLKEAGIVTVESKRDKFFAGSTGTLKGNSYFSQFRIDNLLNDIDITAKYGEMTVSRVSKGFDAISINAVFNDINLTFDPSASYSMDVKHMNSFLSLPSENAEIEKRPVNEERKEYISAGTIGKNPGTRMVRIYAGRGSIIIR